MQKFTSFAVVVCLIGLVIAKPVDRSGHPFTEIVKECEAEYTLKHPDEAIERGAIMLCLNVKLGIQDTNGDIKSEELKKVILDMGIEESAATEIVKRCDKRTSTDPETAALDLFKCMHSK